MKYKIIKDNKKHTDKYWIDSFNIRYQKEIHKDIEQLLKKLFIKWKEDYKNKQDKEVGWPEDVILYEKFIKDIKYLINGKINRILSDIYIKKINNELDSYYEEEKTFNNKWSNEEEMSRFIKYYIEKADDTYDLLNDE